MKKEKIFYLFILLLAVIGCRKKNEVNDSNFNSEPQSFKIKIDSNIASPNGVLHFQNKEQLKRISESIRNDKASIENIVPGNFKSLRALIKEYEKSKTIDLKNTFLKRIKINNTDDLFKSSDTNEGEIEYGNMTDFVYSAYQSLVPDEIFQEFLNEELQIMVDNMLYQVTPLGTFEVEPVQIDYFNQWVTNNSTQIWTNPNYSISGEILIQDGLYQVSDGIFRQDLNDNNQTISYLPDFNSPPTLSTPPNNQPSIITSGPNIPLNTVTANERGEGTSKVGIPGSRRFLFQSYNNRYIIWNSVGIEAKVQRLRRLFWISYWGQSFGDEIIVGIDNLDLETDYFVPTPQTMSSMQMSFPKFKGFKKFKLGNYITDYVAFAIGESGFFFPPNLVSQDAVSRFFNGALNNWSTNQINNVMKEIVPALIDSYIDPTFKDRYKNQPFYLTSYKSISNQFKLRFTAAQVYKTQGYSDNNNWRFDWNIMLSNTGDLPYNYKIKSGNFIAKARVGNNWYGARIVKFKE